jgi:hypothetical protein
MIFTTMISLKEQMVLEMPCKADREAEESTWYHIFINIRAGGTVYKICSIALFSLASPIC